MLKIFYMDIGCDCSYEQSQAFYKILPKERQERIDKLKIEEMREKRVLAGAFMQYGLSRVTHVPIRNICYSYGEQGKPELDWKSINTRECSSFFSLSHSGKYAVLAVSDKPVGADVERLRNNRERVAKRCFHKKEYEDIMALQDEEERGRRFLEYWTMKEAYVKRKGEGLQIPLYSFCIKRGDDGVSHVENTGGADIWFATGCLEEAYSVSVCSEAWEDIGQLFDKKKLPFEKGKRSLFMEEIRIEEIWNAL